MEAITTFFEGYRIPFLVLHVLGVVLGLGGATISDLLFFRFLKDFRISKKEEEVLHVLKNVVLGSLIIIALSGVAVYLSNMQVYHHSPAFLVKMIAVGILTLNGVALHLFVAPHLINFNLKNQKKMGRSWHRLAFALGAISATSWYSVFFIAMLKAHLPFSFGQFLAGYLILLGGGIFVSQFFEARFRKKAAEA